MNYLTSEGRIEGLSAGENSIAKLIRAKRLSRSCSAQSDMLAEMVKLLTRLKDEQEVHHLELADYIRPDENKWFEEYVVGPRVVFYTDAPKQGRLFSEKRLHDIENSKEESIRTQSAATQISALKLENESLKGTIRNSLPYMRVFNFGAGLFCAAVISFLSLIWADVAIPFNPIFAAVTLPVSIVFMIMGYVLKRNGKEWAVTRQSS